MLIFQESYDALYFFDKHYGHFFCNKRVVNPANSHNWNVQRFADLRGGIGETGLFHEHAPVFLEQAARDFVNSDRGARVAADGW